MKKEKLGNKKQNKDKRHFLRLFEIKNKNFKLIKASQWLTNEIDEGNSTNLVI